MNECPTHVRMRAVLYGLHARMPMPHTHTRVRLCARGRVRGGGRGHTPTDYRRWWEAREPYAVAYKRFYEPWFISHWDVLPWWVSGRAGGWEVGGGSDSAGEQRWRPCQL